MTGAMPPIQKAMSATDTFSDTKIFILLAAIVFVFLVALGIAMARVSHTRRNHEQIRQQLVTRAQRQPDTLNKTILDMLPVFEITEKYKLRRLQTATIGPRISKQMECNSPIMTPLVNNLHRDGIIGCSLSRSVTPPPRIWAPMGGYMLDPDRRVSQYSEEHIELTRVCRRQTTHASTPYSQDMPRYYRSDTAEAETAAAANALQHCWNSLDPNQETCAVAFHRRGSKSLDLSSATPPYNKECSHDCLLPQQPSPPPPIAMLPTEIHYSQPNIVSKLSRRLSASSNSSSCASDAGACPICLEEFDVGEQLRELPCKHRYHIVCIDTWLVSRSTSCPYCKMDIRKWYYGSPSPGDASGSDQLEETTSTANRLGQRSATRAPLLHRNRPTSSGNVFGTLRAAFGSHGNFV